MRVIAIASVWTWLAQKFTSPCRKAPLGYWHSKRIAGNKSFASNPSEMIMTCRALGVFDPFVLRWLLLYELTFGADVVSSFVVRWNGRRHDSRRGAASEKGKVPTTPMSACNNSSSS